jgi:hypothetical protein
MNQEENAEIIAQNEGAADASEENAAANETSAESAEKIDNLPIESIGSYARVEELLIDEEAENTTASGSEGST